MAIYDNIETILCDNINSDKVINLLCLKIKNTIEISIKTKMYNEDIMKSNIIGFLECMRIFNTITEDELTSLANAIIKCDTLLQD